jgi:GT2 family glycosyltransferase/glycosyltransferase involved in cell wall biosynthesis
MPLKCESSTLDQLKVELDRERSARLELEYRHNALLEHRAQLAAALGKVVGSRSWRWTWCFRLARVLHRQPRKSAVWILERLLERIGLGFLRSVVSRQTVRGHKVASILSDLDVLVPEWQSAGPVFGAKVRATVQDLSLAGIVSDAPRVSVIIPVYGQLDITVQCLASIQRVPVRCAFEVILIDDCSPEDSVRALASVPGLRFIRNQTNVGFLRSCNAAAAVAKGEYLCFLNNDTEVQAGWLDALLRTFEEFPGCGLAGSKLLNEDGTLQEAGGIVWQDGSAWNFGRGKDAGHCTYNYAREVDYCSGASIMVPSALFRTCGGFDELFVPAYCEDTDLAIRLRQMGYRVIYQPASQVVHLEGATSGRDTKSGVKAYQVTNMEKLFQRWERVLAAHEPSGEKVDQAKDRGMRGRILVIDHQVPTPDCDSGSIDAYNLMLVLRDFGYQVTFASDDGLRFDGRYTPALQRVGVEVLHRPYVESIDAHLQEFGSRYDLVILMRPAVMRSHIGSVQRHCESAKVIFHTVDLHFLRLARQAQVEGSERLLHESERMRDLELSLIDRADLATVVGSQELELLRDQYSRRNVRLLPFSRQTRGTGVGFDAREGCVFVGGFRHLPNVDAVQWLVREVMPLVWKQDPDLKLHIVGPDAPSEVRELACDRVTVHGFVADLDSLLDRCRVSVAPLRYGAGIKGKIGHAMSVGLPSVATSIAVEGMGVGRDAGVVVADLPEDFARAICGLYHSPELWCSLSSLAVNRAEGLWGAVACKNHVGRLFVDLGLDIPTVPRETKLFTNPL